MYPPRKYEHIFAWAFGVGVPICSRLVKQIDFWTVQSRTVIMYWFMSTLLLSRCKNMQFQLCCCAIIFQYVRLGMDSTWVTMWSYFQKLLYLDDYLWSRVCFCLHLSVCLLAAQLKRSAPHFDVIMGQFGLDPDRHLDPAPPLEKCCLCSMWFE